MAWGSNGADIPVDDDDSSVAASGLVDHFFRHESGRLVAQLVRRFGADRLELIEDAVQSALLSALTSWGARGLPDNPSAWLTRVARNRLVDHLRRMGREAPEVDAGARVSAPAEGAFDDEIADDELRMLFVCCDPELPARAQLVLSLKLLCGFGTREIATRLFLSDDNVQKILSRGRARLRALWAERAGDWADPAPARLERRLPAVQAVIYLLFNEGYSSQREDQVIRRELCAEALRLGQLLVAHPIGDRSESWALLALMHFHHARIESRTDAEGHLLLLSEQDRGRWDREEIRRALAALARAQQGRFSRYLGEAAILAEHCVAPTFEQTRWSEIVDLYELLEQHCGPSPLYTLNRAIALAEWQGPEAGLTLLRTLTPPTWLARYYLWDATLGELLLRTGQLDPARRHLERALRAAPTRGERRIFERRLGECGPRATTTRGS